MPKKKTKETQAEQSKAFIEKARELGADVGDAEDEVMRQLARPKRRQKPAKGGKRRTASSGAD